MRLQHFTPGKLEFYQDLESAAAIVTNDVVNLFELHWQQQGELVDRVFELEHFDPLLRYSRLMAAILIEDTARESYQKEAELAAYRGVHFGYLLYSTLLGEDVALSANRYFQGYDDISDVEEVRAGMLADSQLYLQQRPHVDGIIGRHLPEMDPGQSAPEIAEIAAALTYAQIDCQRREFAIEVRLLNIVTPDTPPE